MISFRSSYFLKFYILILLVFTSALSRADVRIISVTGQGSAEYPADAIKINFSIVDRQKGDLNQRKQKIEKASKATVDALVKLGISEKDIFSPAFILRSRNNYNNELSGEEFSEVGREFEITVRDIALYRQTIDALIANGVNSITNVRSELNNRKEYENLAMSAAVNDAKSQATFLVERLDASLGRVHRIGQKNIRNQYAIEEVLVTGARSKPDASPYEFKPKPIKVSASIYIEFEINN